MNYKIAAYSIKNQKTTPTSETPEMYKPTGGEQAFCLIPP